MSNTGEGAYSLHRLILASLNTKQKVLLTGTGLLLGICSFKLFDDVSKEFFGFAIVVLLVFLFTIFQIKNSIASLGKLWTNEVIEPITRLDNVLSMLEDSDFQLYSETDKNKVTKSIHKKLHSIAISLKNNQAITLGLMDAVSDMLFLLENDGTILVANQAALKELDYLEAEITGQHFRKLLAQETNLFDDYLMIEFSLRKSPIIKDFEILVRHRNGEVLPVLLNAQKLLNYGKDGNACIVSLKNRSEFHNLLNQLNRSDRMLRAIELDISEKKNSIESMLQAEMLPKINNIINQSLTNTLSSLNPHQKDFFHPRLNFHLEKVTSADCRGDWIKIVSNPNKFHIIACDCHQKGPSAAVFSSYLQGICYSLIKKLENEEDLAPIQIISLMNSSLPQKCTGFEKLDFSLIVISFDFEQNLVRIANQGYTFPLILSQNLHWTTLSQNKELHDQSILIHEMNFTPGQIFLLYSNGVLSDSCQESPKLSRSDLRKLVQMKFSSEVAVISKEILESTQTKTQMDDKILFVARFVGTGSSSAA